MFGQPCSRPKNEAGLPVFFPAVALDYSSVAVAASSTRDNSTIIVAVAGVISRVRTCTLGWFCVGRGIFHQIQGFSVATRRQ